MEATLTLLFQQYPANTTLPEVLAKVATLDRLYHIRLKDPVQMAQHIVQQRIDPWLRRGHLTAAERIADAECWYDSFATKYCTGHQPETSPLYDRYVNAMLWGYHTGCTSH